MEVGNTRSLNKKPKNKQTLKNPKKEVKKNPKKEVKNPKKEVNFIHIKCSYLYKEHFMWWDISIAVTKYQRKST